MARVLLAMSGGVDSSAAAVLLKRAGHEVIGLFMRTGTHQVESSSCDTKPNKKGCCSALDAGDARRVADRLDIPFHAIDFEEDFDRIIDYFADEYLSGRTPNPCVVCNTWLKFGKLWEFAQLLDAAKIATGHYAQIRTSPDGEPELHRGADLDKDQSYVLHGIRREILSHLMFPVGGYQKPEIREFAREVGLGVADKPDSVEICFVPDGDHVRVVRERRPGQDTSGTFVDRSGTTLGTHDGIERFTIGQRKGLGIATGKRRFVLELVPESNTVVLGDEEDLLATGLVATEINWLIDPPIGATIRCEAKIRYRHEPVRATVTVNPEGGAKVIFDEPQKAVTPGQAVAMYDGSRLLGGGWIERAV